MDALTLDQFTVFVTVIDQGSFTAAARHLKRAQSAITYALQKLEDQSGVALFDRSTYRPSLTEAGHALLPRARRVVETVGDYRLTARGIAKGLEAELTLVIDSLLPVAIVTEALTAFHDAYPSVQLRILCQWHEKAIAAVSDGDADIGILLEFLNARPGLLREVFGEIDLVAVAAPSHPLTKLTPPIEPDVLRDHLQIVVSNPEAARRERDHGVIGLNRWVVSDPQIKHALLRAGLGWGSMPRPLVTADIAAGFLCEIAPARWDGSNRMPRLPVVVARREDRALGPAGTWLLAKLGSGKA